MEGWGDIEARGGARGVDGRLGKAAAVSLEKIRTPGKFPGATAYAKFKRRDRLARSCSRLRPDFEGDPHDDVSTQRP
jgi:hypothetical protein